MNESFIIWIKKWVRNKNKFDLQNNVLSIQFKVRRNFFYIPIHVNIRTLNVRKP